MALKKACILLVEDDARIQRLEQQVMESEGYGVVTAATGEEALRQVAEANPDLVLLDVRLPGIDGLTFCRRLREFSQVPIIMVTGMSSEDEKVQGLNVGADDYVTKPFSARELVARVRSVLRRCNNDELSGEPTFQVGSLIIDFHKNRVTVGGEEVILSDIEYRLLCYMARNAGRILTPEQILIRIWGDEFHAEDHLLHVTISRLRQKLGDDPRKPRYIITRRGIGYSFALGENWRAAAGAAR
jgi:DNA-binding response OmpR family regulator